MKISQLGIDLIKQFEGCKLKAYKDQVGILTIGYGHTGDDVTENLFWTKAQCDAQLSKDLKEFSRQVSELVGTAILTQGQFDAMCSFAYNLGIGSLKRSTLLAKCLQGDIPGAADEFLKWNMAAGQPEPGLTRRRQAERAMFLS